MACINKPEMDLFRSMKSAGQIQVIFGPMFSGKTTELMRRVKRYQLANYNCLVIKYSNDTRYDQNGIATHDRQVLPALCTTELSNILDEALDHNVIGVDEGQFFPDIVPFCEQMAEKGKIVIVAALDGTYQRKGFGDILNLVPIAESVVKLNAVCVHCYGEASFTKRKGSETALEVIGGPEKYMAVCRSCYKEQVSPVCSPNSKSEICAKMPGSAGKTAVRNHSFGVEITNTMDLSQ